MRDWLIYVLFFGFMLFVITLLYLNDRDSCYEKAMFYESKVEGYSWLKQYCFVRMNDRRVNLDNYRDVVEIK